MKKELTFRYDASFKKNAALSEGLFSLKKANRMLLSSAPLLALSRYYSQIMEKPVSPARSLRILHAQTAFLFLTCSLCTNLLTTLLLLAWALWALKSCRRAEN